MENKLIIGNHDIGKDILVIDKLIPEIMGNSMIIFDPYGRYYENMKEKLENEKYHIEVIDADDSRNIGIIRKEDIPFLSKLLVKELENDGYFYRETALLLECIMNFIIEDYGNPLTLYSVWEFLNIHYIEDFINLIKSSCEEKTRKYAILLDQIGNDLKNIILNAIIIMQPYSKKSYFEYDYKRITTEKTVIFLQYSVYKVPNIRNVFTEYLLQYIFEKADKEKMGKLSIPVTFIFDDLFIFGRIPRLEALVSVSKSRNIEFWIIFDNQFEFEQYYEDDSILYLYDQVLILTND